MFVSGIFYSKKLLKLIKLRCSLYIKNIIFFLAGRISFTSRSHFAK